MTEDFFSGYIDAILTSKKTDIELFCVETLLI